MEHPQVGALQLRREKLPIAGSGGQVLAILHAAAGSESARALQRLGDVATPGPLQRSL